MDGQTIAENMADNIQSKRVKVVQIGIMFNASTDAEALGIKERINAIISDNPAIQMTFTIMDRPVIQGK